MTETMREPLSAIMKKMAMTTLADPHGVPSAEAVAASLLLSHVAWQRANGDEFSDFAYELPLTEMEKSNLRFWREMKSSDCDALIAELMAYKKRHYPLDMRTVVLCGIVDDKVRVEWVERGQPNPYDSRS